MIYTISSAFASNGFLMRVLPTAFILECKYAERLCNVFAMEFSDLETTFGKPEYSISLSTCLSDDKRLCADGHLPPLQGYSNATGHR
jgi:hypothetical protein